MSRLLALLLILPMGCRSWQRRNDATVGDFFGVSAKSAAHWRAALDRPARNIAAATLVAGAAALQIGDTDRDWQRKIKRGNWMPGTEQGKASDIISWTLIVGAVGAPMLVQPHPEWGVDRRDYLTTGVYATAVNLALNQIVRVAVNRRRPSRSKFSFYSGHTTVAFTGAQLLQRAYGWKAGVPAYALATMAGFYRIEADRHWPSDVLVGAAAGIFVTDLIWEKNLGEKGLFRTAGKVALVPIVTRERVGAQLAWNW